MPSAAHLRNLDCKIMGVLYHHAVQVEEILRTPSEKSNLFEFFRGAAKIIQISEKYHFSCVIWLFW